MAQDPHDKPTGASASASIAAATLTGSAALAGSGYRIEPSLEGQESALSGSYRLVRLRPGLTLHAADTTDLHDLTTRIVQRAGLTFYIFLSDSDGLDASVGDLPLPAGRHGAHADQPTGLIVNRATPEVLVRRASRGTRLRKVTVTVSPEWIEQCWEGNAEPPPGILRQHLGMAAWQPSPRLVGLIQEVLEPTRPASPLGRLFDETVALETIAEALGATLEPAHAGSERRRDAMKAAQIREFVEAHLRSPFTIDDMARELATSPTTLQRLFRSTFGTTIFDYVRARRLDIARDLLDADLATIAQAAHMAGYTSAANFATAFRRRFGLSPRDARRR